MAPRKYKGSTKSNRHSLSHSPQRRTDTRDDEQHTAPEPSAGAPPHILRESLLQVAEEVEERPRQSRLSGRVIPDSQEDPTDSDFFTDDTNRIQSSGRVIPDSQEDPADFDFSADDTEDELLPEQATASSRYQCSDSGDTDVEEEDPQVLRAIADGYLATQSYNTEDTVLIPGGVKLTPARNLLHKQGINCNGRLAAEHPDFEDMEEEATQPSTQPRVDPRRHGSSSMLSVEDEADVVCILHPATPAAYEATKLIAKYCPQHILQNHGLSYNLDYEGIEEAPTTEPKVDDNDLDYSQTGDVRGMDMPESSPRDIALRFSSRVHDMCMGWSFGRNPLKCDLPIVGSNETLKISNRHFRIYLNTYGVLMLEDTSTNGTWVDHNHLQMKPGHAGQKSRRTIQQGSMIEILLSAPDPCMRFIVNIPSRDRGEAKYNQKLGEYMALVKQLDGQARVVAEGAATGNVMAPPAVLPLGHVQRLASQIAPSIFAPPSSYNPGMVAWNGGDTYNVVGQIGKGAFATVYKLATKQDGELFAAKEIEKRKFMKDGILSHKAHNEILVMKQLNHPNIIDYVGYEETSKYLYIIMEYVAYGDLTQYINGDSVMPEFNCRYVAHQMMKALDYLHTRNITHRDIKPDNILIASSDPFIVKLTDFGLSKVIANEETFLTTFCGTLLYLAPEVYPGYEKVKAGLPQRRRPRGELDEKKLPYQSSADTWAFAAVLYHLMCGKPPYLGSTENRGAQMLEVIMHNPVDFQRLARAGISPEGVDFVRKMLVHEPSQRATDAECLRHPWIVDLSLAEDADIETEPSLEDPVDIEEGQELDASQLSLYDRPEHADDNDLEEIGDGGNGSIDADELEQLGRSKRLRMESPRAMGFRPEDPSSSGDSYDTVPMMFVPAANRQEVYPHPAHAPARLFGEIGISALRSSGVLGQDAHAALDMSPEGSRDESSGVSVSSHVIDFTESHVSSNRVSHHSSQHPQTHPGPAPSLLGTEALVDRMNMASPESGPSAPPVESTSGTPQTPQSRELSPSASSITGVKRSSQDLQADPEQTASKRVKSHRSSSPSQPPGTSGIASISSHAAEASGRGFISSDQHQQLATLPESQAQNITAGQGTSEHQGQPSGDAGEGKGKATAASNTGDNHGQDATEVAGSQVITQGSSDSSSGTHSASTSTVQDTPTPAPQFPLPAPIIGRLNTVPGSVIETAHFNLTTRHTFYGRCECEPRSEGDYKPVFTNYIYPHGLDDRVPKNALDLVFWRPGIETDDKNGVDWIALDNFWALIMTRTSYRIYVNDVKLTRGTDRLNYGKLYTGDVITVFAPTEEGAQGKEAEYLKFECEFFAGLSKPRRPEGHPFTVETEYQKFQEERARRSRQASMAASTAGEASTTGTGSETTPAK